MYLYIIKRFSGRISIKTTNNINNIKINKDSILIQYKVNKEFRLKQISEYLNHIDGIIFLKNTNYLIQIQYINNDIKLIFDNFFNM